MTEKRWLIIILTLFSSLGIVYAFQTPLFEASDELWHYPMVKHLADGNALPIQVFDPKLAGPWKQEASQPPLYYYLGGLLTFWIDTSDMDEIRRLNPHVDNGVLTTDGNINLVVHDANANPLRGTLLAVRIVRLFSVLLGATTVYLTYRIAKRAVPGRAEIALGAAAANAFLPMFIFISGAVNNDNLVITLASLSLLLMIHLGQDEVDSRVENIEFLLLGCLLGLGALTKITALGLIPLALGAVLVNRWRTNGRMIYTASIKSVIWQTAGRFGLIAAPFFLIAGWWYWRNISLYGDWSGWNAFIAVLGQRQTPASLAQLWDESWGFMISYWGLFGGLNVAMPEWIYRILNLAAITSVIGLFLYAFLQIKNYLSKMKRPIHGLGGAINQLMTFVERYLALILCVLWTAAVAVGLIRWAAVTWSSQGRLVFSAISALSTLMIVGLAGWLPKRPATIITAVFSSSLFIVAAAAPFLWIQPAYQLSDIEYPGKPTHAAVDFGNTIRLNEFAVKSQSLSPGDTLEVAITWEILEETERDWSVFVHVIDTLIGQPIAQRDMYLGQGLRPTSLLKRGDKLTNLYHIRLPDSAISPAKLELVAGLYDISTGERLETKSGEDAFLLGEVDLEPIQGAVPNPVKFNFENQIELVGFDLSPRKLEAGEKISLILYWRPLKRLDKDYTFFAQVVDDDTTRWASEDTLYPTLTWAGDDIQGVEFDLVVDSAAPAGLYPLIIGLYTRPEDNNFDRLQLVTAEGRLTDDFLVLTRVLVENR